MDFIVKNWALVALTLISGGMLLWPLLRRSAGGPWVDTLQATQLLNREDAILVDVRSAADYAAGHILGARSLPLAELERRAGELDKHKARPVIVYCNAGNTSGGAVSALRKGGFEKVFNLSGGYAAWQQAGLPVEK